MVSSSFVVLVSSSEVLLLTIVVMVGSSPYGISLRDIPVFFMHAMLADEIFNFLYMYSNLLLTFVYFKC